MKKTLITISIALNVLLLCAFVDAELHFHFTPQEAQTVVKGLGKLPYEEAAPIIQKMVAQANDLTLQKIKK